MPKGQVLSIVWVETSEAVPAIVRDEGPEAVMAAAVKHLLPGTVSWLAISRRGSG